MASPPNLASRTTLGVGGPPDVWVTARSEQELVAAVSDCDHHGVPVLLLGGGSNMVVGDEGFRGTVVEIASRGVQTRIEGADVVVEAAAGEPWDDLVARCTGEGWSGLEALSGIPGLVGASPVQNVGAYGQDVSRTVDEVRALDRRTGELRALAADECGFTYRGSTFKTDADRWVVLSVSFRLSTVPRGEVRYAELARALDVSVGDPCDIAAIRTSVLALRRAKGMVLDPRDPDTCSVGSFFMNPIVDDATAARIPDGCPRYPAVEGVKLSAAWLIENSGVPRGFRVRPDSPAAVSSKHTLALTNTGGAHTSDVIDLARVIRDRVHESFGITLRPEARLVNCVL